MHTLNYPPKAKLILYSFRRFWSFVIGNNIINYVGRNSKFKQINMLIFGKYFYMNLKSMLDLFISKGQVANSFIRLRRTSFTNVSIGLNRGHNNISPKSQHVASFCGSIPCVKSTVWKGIFLLYTALFNIMSRWSSFVTPS